MLLEGCSSGCTCVDSVLDVAPTFDIGLDRVSSPYGVPTFIVNIGFNVTGKITVKGNKKLCKWKYYDQGSITTSWSDGAPKPQPFDSTQLKMEGGPDDPLTDRPGIGETRMDATTDGYSAPFWIDYSNFSTRLDCIGSDGKVQKTATSQFPKGRQNGIGTFHTAPPGITVTGPQ